MSKKEKNKPVFLPEEYITSYILSVVLSGGVFYIYFLRGLGYIAITLAAAAICYFMFRLCIAGHTKGFTGKLFVVLFVFADIYVFSHMAAGGVFRENFFFADNTSAANFRFLVCLLLSVPVFFGLTVCYFGAINYRMVYLVLISLMSCVLYVKNVQEVNNFFIGLFMLLNMLIYAERKYKTEDGTLCMGGIGIRGSVVTFLCILMITASFIPKENEARYYDKFRRFFMNYNITSELGMDYSNLSNTSGNADNYENIKNRRMYTVWSEEPLYLKRQNFDYYDFENDNWYADEYIKENTYSIDEWSERNNLASIVALQTAMARTAQYDPSFAEKYGIEGIINGTHLEDRIKQAYIQSHNFSAVYYLAPPRCANIFAGSNPEPVALENGSFSAAEGMHQNNTTYQVMYYEDIEARKQWIAAGGADFDISRSGKMLSEMVNTLFDNYDPFWRVAGIYNVRNNEAVIYNFRCKKNNRLISPQIKELAEKITEGCIYDYEKAEVLQNYFHNNKFVYDMEYVAEDTSPEYFLFESKRGTCSDFASAYVLLARSAGLTVRYAEGYVPEKTPVENAFAVTDATAHAYPEVYIQNFGWTVYEPTVASPYNTFGSSGFSFEFGNIEIDMSMIFTVFMLILCLIAGTFAMKVFVPFADDRLFLYRVRGKDPSSAVVMLHKRLAEKNVWNLISDGKSLTPYEMAERIKALTGFEVHNLAFLTEKVSYEGGSAANKDKAEAVELYKALRKNVKKYGRKK